MRRPFAMRGDKLRNREQKEANNPCGLIAHVFTSRQRWDGFLLPFGIKAYKRPPAASSFSFHVLLDSRQLNQPVLWATYNPELWLPQPAGLPLAGTSR